MRVAIAQEWIIKRGGSERVVEAMRSAFPGATVLTTLLDAAAVPLLGDARTSFLQRIPGATRHHEWYLPLMPLAWKTMAVPDSDLVVSSSHSCAKAVRPPAGVPHLCYCHTPMRYAWDFESERKRFPLPVRSLARQGMRAFRAWDRRSAVGVTEFIANSSAVAARIRRYYGRSAEVIHPPVRTDYFTPGGERGGDFLYVGRLVSYKRADLVVEAFSGLPYGLNVVGTGHLAKELRASAGPNVTFLGEVADEQLRDLYRSARALVFPANEDFGIAMAEAQACGTPVISLREGGAADIVTSGQTGWLIEKARVEDVRRAVQRAADEPLDPAVIRAGAERFSEERFVAEIREAARRVVYGRV
jgi:glycosyltransferase involved in cell wall biosynthesis